MLRMHAGRCRRSDLTAEASSMLSLGSIPVSACPLRARARGRAVAAWGGCESAVRCCTAPTLLRTESWPSRALPSRPDGQEILRISSGDRYMYVRGGYLSTGTAPSSPPTSSHIQTSPHGGRRRESTLWKPPRAGCWPAQARRTAGLFTEYSALLCPTEKNRAPVGLETPAASRRRHVFSPPHRRIVRYSVVHGT